MCSESWSVLPSERTLHKRSWKHCSNASSLCGINRHSHICRRLSGSADSCCRAYSVPQLPSRKPALRCKALSWCHWVLCCHRCRSGDIRSTAAICRDGQNKGSITVHDAVSAVSSNSRIFCPAFWFVHESMHHLHCKVLQPHQDSHADAFVTDVASSHRQEFQKRATPRSKPLQCCRPRILC